jgi:DNA-directed RNA polymerase specialized sigma24 family protein
MARTFAEAIGAVEGAEFDAVVGYTVKRPAPRPVEEEVATAFRDFDYGEILRIERMLVSRHHCHLADAEEAVHEVLEELLVKRPDLYRERPENWLGLLFKLARFRILDNRIARSRVASIEELVELAGDAPFEKARHCIADSGFADEDARYAAPPTAGEKWSREQIVGALQRFRDRNGRPPRSVECTVLNGLPGATVIYARFGSLPNAILAAGMMPETPPKTRARWIPLEVARACRSFRRRNGYWPNWADVKHRPGELPGTTAMIRCFGGTRSIDVQLGTEAILAGAED